MWQLVKHDFFFLFDDAFTREREDKFLIQSRTLYNALMSIKTNSLLYLKRHSVEKEFTP
jgi:hypothetical protein